MKKLKVNTEGCIGCGACFGLDPEHFTSNEEGLSIVKSEKNIKDEEIENVINACPVNVISYEEIEESCHCADCCDHCCCEQDDKKAA